MESRMRKSLGKALEALLTAPTPAAAPSELTVAIHEIVPNPEQPRRHFDDEALGQLADSIRRHGLLQPLVVRHIAGRYELIAGERRLRAATRAGLARVPVIVREARAEDRLELALIENVQRENLTALEEAEAYRQLLDQHGLTQDELAERVGKSRAACAAREAAGRGPSNRRPSAWARRGAHAGSRHARADHASPAWRLDRDRVLLRRRARPPDRPPPPGPAARLTALTPSGSR